MTGTPAACKLLQHCSGRPYLELVALLLMKTQPPCPALLRALGYCTSIYLLSCQTGNDTIALQYYVVTIETQSTAAPDTCHVSHFHTDLSSCHVTSAMLLCGEQNLLPRQFAGTKDQATAVLIKQRRGWNQGWNQGKHQAAGRSWLQMNPGNLKGAIKRQ